MDTQAIRITIELPQAAEIQTSSGAISSTATGVGAAGAAGAIDAGPPPPSLLVTLGDPEVPLTQAAVTDHRTVASTDAIDAGSFPAGLAMEMEAKGPRHPLGHPEIGMLATGTSPILSREARN
jgi:hypothetical protein